MPASFQRINPFLWFDDQAEEAVGFYTVIFPNSRIGGTIYYSQEGAGLRPCGGSVMTVAFELDGQQFTALNGGPAFQFGRRSRSSSIAGRRSQAEVDHYWARLSEGGNGVSWQVCPRS